MLQMVYSNVYKHWLGCCLIQSSIISCKRILLRIGCAVKNRFGSTNEIGIFEMQEVGLVEVSNPSELFLSERPLGVTGSTVVASMEGTRPVLVGEVRGVSRIDHV